MTEIFGLQFDDKWSSPQFIEGDELAEHGIVSVRQYPFNPFFAFVTFNGGAKEIYPLVKVTEPNINTSRYNGSGEIFYGVEFPGENGKSLVIRHSNIKSPYIFSWNARRN